MIQGLRCDRANRDFTEGYRRDEDISPSWKSYWVIKPPISLFNQQLHYSTMVMLNVKTYAPSSYVGSPRFTRMEKTARTTFSDGEKYPTTKEVRLLLTLRLVSVVVTGYRSSTPPSLGRKTRRRTLGTSSRSSCLLTTWFIMGAWLPSTRTNWIVVRTTCP